MRGGATPGKATVCVIGAGPAGLTALKALTERGVAPECFEMGSHVGGLWAFENDNGRGGTYRSLHINTSTTQMEFADFPMPTDIGDFPSHVHMAHYFRAYAENFSLMQHIHFYKEVAKCTPTEGGYEVRVRDRRTGEETVGHFDALVVANGHHWSPAFPERANYEEFSGAVLHSSDYVDPVTPHRFARERVLVVGLGNSAVDIACELSREARSASVSVSARRGAWVLPKYLLGKPIDQGRVIPLWLPAKLRRRLVTRAFVALRGRMRDFGLPEPDHLIGEAHPTVSTDFPELVKSGAVRMCAGFESARGKTVRFMDGKTDDFDAIVFCTGYKVKFPFFEEKHVSAPDNALPLYHRAFHLTHRRVFFVGLAQTVGAIMPVAEKQAVLIAEHLTGGYNLPDEGTMRTQVEALDAEMKARFVSSPRHSMQVIVEDFFRRYEADLALGRRRAIEKRGLAFPLPQAAVCS